MLCNSVIFCVIPCNFVIVTCQLFFVVFVFVFLSLFLALHGDKHWTSHL